MGVSPLNPSDLGSASDYYTPFNALTRTFAGTDTALQADFWNTFAPYLAGSSFPGCPAPSSSRFYVATYLKPYEFHEQAFLDWLATHGRADFLSSTERGTNDHRGNLDCPVFTGAPSLAQLKRTHGLAIVPAADHLDLLVDNTVNPLRWIAPINEVHAHEQPSLYALFNATPSEVALTRGVLTAFRAGDHSTRILLEYDLDLQFDDESSVFQEYSAADSYGAPHASATDLPGLTHDNVVNYAGGASAGGHVLSALEGALVQRYFDTRYLAPSFQLSVGVNFLQDGHKYRLQEFQLAGRNYQDSIYAPPSPGAPGFKPTANDTMNQYIHEGGNSGNVGWTRLRVDALALPAAVNPEFNPVVSGGQYTEISGATATLHFSGTLDLTNYYVLSRGHQFFPGQRGYWDTRWVGFEGDDPQYVDPAETHAIYWAGVIFENHGPQRAQVRVNRLVVRTQ